MTANGVDVVDEGSALEEFDHRKMILESGTLSDAGPARAPHAMKNTKRLPSKCGKRRPGHQPIGVRFISVQDQIDTDSPMGRAMFTIIGAMAELESSLISERVSPPS